MTLEAGDQAIAVGLAAARLMPSTNTLAAT